MLMKWHSSSIIVVVVVGLYIGLHLNYSLVPSVPYTFQHSILRPVLLCMDGIIIIRHFHFSDQLLLKVNEAVSQVLISVFWGLRYRGKVKLPPGSKNCYWKCSWLLWKHCLISVLGLQCLIIWPCIFSSDISEILPPPLRLILIMNGLSLSLSV